MIPPKRRIVNDDWKYQCCCGHMSSVTGCKVIAIVELVATLLAVTLLIVFYCVFHSDTYAYQLMVSVGSLAVGLCCCIGALIGIGALFVGVQAENPQMLFLHMIVQVIAMIGMGFVIIAAIITLIGWSRTQFGPDVYLKPYEHAEGRIQDQYAAQTTGSTVAGIILAFSVIGVILNSWFMTVVYSAFRYFKDRAAF